MYNIFSHHCRTVIATSTSTTLTVTNHLGKRRSRSRGRSESPKKKSKKYSKRPFLKIPEKILNIFGLIMILEMKM